MISKTGDTPCWLWFQLRTIKNLPRDMEFHLHAGHQPSRRCFPSHHSNCLGHASAVTSVAAFLAKKGGMKTATKLRHSEMMLQLQTALLGFVVESWRCSPSTGFKCLWHMVPFLPLSIYLSIHLMQWFVLICVYPPSNNSYTLFKVGCQKNPPQKKYDPAFK